MKKIVFILSCICIGISSAFAQSSYDVKKVCYGAGSSAMVVEYENQYYVITSDRLSLTEKMIVADIPAIHFGGYSQMRFYTADGTALIDYGQVIKSGQSVILNNRWQRFFYSGLPGAKSICRQIANGR